MLLNIVFKHFKDYHVDIAQKLDPNSLKSMLGKSNNSTSNWWLLTWGKVYWFKKSTATYRNISLWRLWLRGSIERQKNINYYERSFLKVLGHPWFSGYATNYHTLFGTLSKSTRICIECKLMDLYFQVKIWKNNIFLILLRSVSYGQKYVFTDTTLTL